MEIIVTIKKINDIQEYQARNGNTYKKFSFVGETDEQYAKNICFTCGNENIWQKFNLVIGEQFKICFDISSREWNGRWFTEANAWRATQLSGTPQKTEEKAVVADEKGKEEVPF